MGEMVTFSIVSTTREADFAVSYNPASGVIKDTKRFVFTLDRERSKGCMSSGSHTQILNKYRRNYI